MINCDYCDETFTPHPKATKRVRFCSKQCKRAWYYLYVERPAKEQSGEGAANRLIRARW